MPPKHTCFYYSLQDTYIEEDKDLVTSYFELGEDEKLKRMSPWLLRIELNREMMVDKKLTMGDVAERIDREFNDELHCIFSDDNAEKLILRVRASSPHALHTLDRTSVWSSPFRLIFVRLIHRMYISIIYNINSR